MTTKMSPEGRAADTEQSDKEYIAQQQEKLRRQLRTAELRRAAFAQIKEAFKPKQGHEPRGYGNITIPKESWSEPILKDGFFSGGSEFISADLEYGRIQITVTIIWPKQGAYYVDDASRPRDRKGRR